MYDKRHATEAYPRPRVGGERLATPRYAKEVYLAEPPERHQCYS